MTLPNIKACAVAGRIEAGADCAYTLDERTEELGYGAFVAFLEEGAICSSAADWNKMKTALEQACKKIKCSREQLEALDGAVAREFFAERLQ